MWWCGSSPAPLSPFTSALPGAAGSTGSAPRLPHSNGLCPASSARRRTAAPRRSRWRRATAHRRLVFASHAVRSDPLDPLSDSLFGAARQYRGDPQGAEAAFRVAAATGLARPADPALLVRRGDGSGRCRTAPPCAPMHCCAPIPISPPPEPCSNRSRRASARACGTGPPAGRQPQLGAGLSRASIPMPMHRAAEAQERNRAARRTAGRRARLQSGSAALVTRARSNAGCAAMAKACGAPPAAAKALAGVARKRARRRRVRAAGRRRARPRRSAGANTRAGTYGSNPSPGTRAGYALSLRNSAVGQPARAVAGARACAAGEYRVRAKISVRRAGSGRTRSQSRSIAERFRAAR